MAQMLFRQQAIDLSYWAGLLSPEDCQSLIQIGKSLLQPAMVTDPLSGQLRWDSARASEMAWPNRAEYPLLQKIAAGVERLTGIPQENQEPLQILHYRPGGEYRPHFDAFPESSKTLAQGGNRQMTLILYLNTPAAGGDTAFPELSMTVSPIAGCGVLFKNLDEVGHPHPLSLHAGLPVRQGEKWIATTWIRECPYTA